MHVRVAEARDDSATEATPFGCERVAKKHIFEAPEKTDFLSRHKASTPAGLPRRSLPKENCERKKPPGPDGRKKKSAALRNVSRRVSRHVLGHVFGRACR